MRPATRDSGCSACCSIVSPFDVPLQLVVFVSRLLAGRREVGTRRRTRALTCIRQAVFTLAWFWDRPDIRMLGARSADLAARTAYSASKAALLNVTKSPANLPGPVGIRVNAVAPEWINAVISTDTSAAGDLTPLGRNGTPEEVAAVVQLLLGDEARFVTGASLIVDAVTRTSMRS
jgi:NAD(P)-dependent dehydrogenase (short-subunit alcohol dehydrogenase family)